MNFRTLDLNLLRVFDAVMAERNLSRAAEQLAMTQPAVSNALRRLREHLGEPLFARAAHGVRPTPRAEALWPPVQAALQGLQHELEPQHFNPRTHAQRFQLGGDLQLLLEVHRAAGGLFPVAQGGVENADMVCHGCGLLELGWK